MNSQNLGKVYARPLAGLLAALSLCGSAFAQQYIINTVCGIPQVQGYFGDGGLATGAQLYQPSKIVTDSKGNYYFSDYFTNVVRMVTVSSGNVSTVAGNGTPGFGGDNEVATSANITDVHGIAVDSNGNVYISDTANHRIRRVDAKSGNITTFAGNGTAGNTGDGNAATAAEINLPAGLALDSSGNLYVGDYGNYNIRKITSSGTISTIAGTGSWGYSGDGGSAAKAALAYPISLAFDGAGNLYVGDIGNSNIRRIGTDGNISTYLSNVNPQGMAVDATGVIYLVDGVTPAVWKIMKSGVALVIAGNGTAGYSGDTGVATRAQLDHPAGVAVDASGNVYVADTNNQIIRVLQAQPFSIGGMTNAASGIQAPIAPGEIVAVYGAGMGPSTLATFSVTNGYISTQISGSSIYFNTIQAPLVYVSSTVLAAIVPYELAGVSSVNVTLNVNGKVSPVTSVPVAPAAPGIFTANASGSGQAAAINQDGTVNSASKPAKAGSIVSLYITGDGLPNPAPSDGQLVAKAPYPLTVLPVKISIGGLAATVSYSGATPTAVAGLTQVNVQIPSAVTPGPAVPVTLQVGGVAAQSGVTIAVQ